MFTSRKGLFCDRTFRAGGGGTVESGESLRDLKVRKLQDKNAGTYERSLKAHGKCLFKSTM